MYQPFSVCDLDWLIFLLLLHLVSNNYLIKNENLQSSGMSVDMGWTFTTAAFGKGSGEPHSPWSNEQQLNYLGKVKAASYHSAH